MGFNIVLSSPSGAGKTTITKKISQKYPNVKISISHTTRKPRSNEIDGVDYHFINEENFKKLVKQIISMNTLRYSIITMELKRLSQKLQKKIMTLFLILIGKAQNNYLSIRN